MSTDLDRRHIEGAELREEVRVLRYERAHLRAQLAKLVEAARDLAFCAEHMTPGNRTLNECAAVVRAVLDEIEGKP